MIERRLQNSPLFAYSSTREQSNKRSGTRLRTENETWGEKLKILTPFGRVRLERFARVRLLRHALPISLLILRKKKPTVLPVYLPSRHLLFLLSPPCPCWSAIRFSKTDQWRLELWKLIKELNLEYLKSPCSVYLTWLLFDLIRK